MSQVVQSQVASSQNQRKRSPTPRNNESDSESNSSSDSSSSTHEWSDNTVTYDKPPTHFSDNIPVVATNTTKKDPKTCCTWKGILLFFIVSYLGLCIIASTRRPVSGLIKSNSSNVTIKNETTKPVTDWWSIYGNVCCLPTNAHLDLSHRQELFNYGYRLYDCSATNRCLYYLSNWLQSRNLTTKSSLVSRCCYDVRAYGNPFSHAFCSLACLNTVH